MNTIKEQIPMVSYCISIGAVQAEIIAGPNGDFIVFTLKDESQTTLPVGGRSQGMDKPSELEVLCFVDGGAVATCNQYVAKGVEVFA